MSAPEFYSIRTANYSLILGCYNQKVQKVYDGPSDEVREEEAKKAFASSPAFPSDIHSSPSTFVSCFGALDFREPLLQLVGPDSFFTFRFLLKKVEVRDAKEESDEFPHARLKEKTHVFTYRDEREIVEVRHYLTPYFEEDAIVSKVEILSLASSLCVKRAFSLQLDLGKKEYEIYTFTGKWAHERHITKNEVHHGVFVNASHCGASSAFRNPAILLKGKTEPDVILANLIYSGNHKSLVEVDHNDSTRLLIGMNDFLMEEHLSQGQVFSTPEAVYFRGQTIDEVKTKSNTFAEKYILRPNQNRVPVIFNSWEGYEYRLNASNLGKCAHLASRIGAEIFVLDDGWYGKRNSTKTSLGDWTLNKERYPSFEFIRGELNKYKLGLGLWVEPEMVSQDSDLYREHPEYAMEIPGLSPLLQRDQLILNLASPIVVDALIEKLSALFSEAKPVYVKWDMNRLFTDVYSSSCLGGGYVYAFQKGLYRLLSTLMNRFPDILFEGCASGGARFDLGMLYYFPFIWTSDGTDAKERIFIQDGTNLVYPLRTLSNHVSGIPNQQTGKKSSLEDRINVALFGRFGYELDLTEVNACDLASMKKASQWYRKRADFLMESEVHIADNNASNIVSWTAVNKNKDEAYAFLASLDVHGTKTVRLAGLAEEAIYELSFRQQENTEPEVFPPLTGKALMEDGITISHFFMENDEANNEVGIATRILHLKKLS